MARASAAPVFPDALCLARFATVRAGYGAHAGLPSAGRLIPLFTPRLVLGDGGWSGPYVTCRPAKGPEPSFTSWASARRPLVAPGRDLRPWAAARRWPRLEAWLRELWFWVAGPLGR